MALIQKFSQFVPKNWLLPSLHFNISRKFSADCKDNELLFSSTTVTDITKRIPSSKVEQYQKLLMLQPDTPPDGRLLKVAVLGCPNAGKSSLVNMLTNFRVCAVSQKVNTTRSKQNIALTKDNVQVIFIDMPGIVGKVKARAHRLDLSLIRDPHAGIFESDLIMVLVDISVKHMRYELDKEILKALHFFNDKPAVLVLNKIDKIKRDRGRLLDITRRLTRGIVSGVQSHRDKYHFRYSKNFPTLPDLLESPKIRPLLKKHAPELLALEDEQTSLINSESNSSQEKELDQKIQQNVPDIVEQPETVDIMSLAQPKLLKEVLRSKSPEELKEIELYFKNYHHNKPKVSPDITKLTEEDLDPVIILLKNQLMIKKVDKSEVYKRRQRWKEIQKLIQNETDWPHFKEVFMVSAATGEGIENLRNYLMTQARPGLWAYHSSIVTDEDPDDIICMCVWAHCLNNLEKEIPYHLKLNVNNVEKGPDGILYVHVTVNCRSERHLKSFIGLKGSVIKKIADDAKVELANTFQVPVVLKLSAVRATIPKGHLKAIKSSGDLRLAFPDMPHDA